jgi:hypothetical protein
MGMFAATVLVLGIVVIAAGPEAHRVAFGQDQPERGSDQRERGS